MENVGIVLNWQLFAICQLNMTLNICWSIYSIQMAGPLWDQDSTVSVCVCVYIYIYIYIYIIYTVHEIFNCHMTQMYISVSQFRHSYINCCCSNYTPSLPQDGSSISKRDNPHKYLLYKPTFSQLFTFLASGFKELPPTGAMLLYISADGSHGNLKQTDDSKSMSPGKCLRKVMWDIFLDISFIFSLYA